MFAARMEGKRFYLKPFLDNSIQHIIITLVVLIFVTILNNFIGNYIQTRLKQALHVTDAKVNICQ